MEAWGKYHAISDIGCIRKNNEDMAYVAGKLVRDGEIEGDFSLENPCVAFAVADGMGGYEGGEVASEIVCRSFSTFIKDLVSADVNTTIRKIKDWAIEANGVILETASLRYELSEMGTTFIALIYSGEKLYLLNVGDSRCYRIRAGILKQLSTDHSERERTGNPEVPSNLIYNFMGIPSGEFFSDVTELTPLEGDSYILCSDGLSDLVDSDYIETHHDSVENLVSQAKLNGGRDNITIVKIEL